MVAYSPTRPVFLGDAYTTSVNNIEGAANFGRTSGGVWLPVLVDANGNIGVSGSITVTSDAVATAAAPAYIEGSTNALSTDPFGNLRVGPDSLAVSGSVSSAAVLFTQDMTGYNSLGFQFTAVGSGNTVTVEGSEDNSTWVTVVNYRVDNGAAGGAQTTVTPTTTGKWMVNRASRYVRVRVSTYGSATVTLVGSLTKATWAIPNSFVIGSVASGSADSGNPVKVAGVFVNPLVAVTTGQRRDISTSSTGGILGAVLDITGAFPTNALSVVNATNSTGNGITAAGLVAQFDDVSPTTIAENQFGNVRMTADRMLYALPSYSFTGITTSTTTTVKSGAGILHAVTINTKGTVASTITIYDNTAGSGTKIGIIDSLNLSGAFLFDVAFATGLTLVTTGTLAPDITVSYK